MRLKSGLILVAGMLLMASAIILYQDYLNTHSGAGLHDFSGPKEYSPGTGDLFSSLWQDGSSATSEQILTKKLKSVRNDMESYIRQLGKSFDPSKSVMGQMGNTTLRQELGQSTWRLLHVMATRYPSQPNEMDRVSFELFVLLLSKLYPCGDCAAHFRMLLAKNPPTFESKKGAALWMCERHNAVNTRLGKELFDCDEALERWKCGCPDAEDEMADEAIAETSPDA